MPYRWQHSPVASERSGAAGAADAVLAGPEVELRLWPYRSLPPQGFVLFIGSTAALIALPLLTLLGSPALWALLPFGLAALAAIWWALRLSYRSGEVLEELRLWPDRVTLTRRDARGGVRRWEANPHWVRASLHPSGGPVPNYLTLAGAGRTVEIGAFLSEEERIALKPEIEGALARLP